MHRIKIIEINEGKEIQATAKSLKVKKKKTKKTHQTPNNLFPARGNIYDFIDFHRGPDFFDQEQSQITYLLLSSV